MGDQVDTTASDTMVDASSSVTTPSSVVSTPPSDADQRIRNLMSLKDKAVAEASALKSENIAIRNQLNQAIMERANLQAQLDSDTSTIRGQLDQASSATQDSLNREAKLGQENATLRKENAKLAFLMENPELQLYQKVAPATDNKEELEAFKATIVEARNKDIGQVKDRMAVGLDLKPPAANSSQKTDRDSLLRQLREASGDPATLARIREQMGTLASG